MKSTTLRVALVVIVVGLSLSACGTTESTTETTENFLSSTSPRDLFTQDGLIRQEQKINASAGVAYENLRHESAVGGGEYVTSLATLYGLPVARHAEFGNFLQAHHSDLFRTDGREDRGAHLKMVTALNQALQDDGFFNR
jgi:hypothetical protein